MPSLQRELRQVLDRTVVEARAAAESAARAALSTLAVDRDKAFDQLSEPDRELRRALRAKERQLGSYEALVSEIAYQHWHRMLFARFLAENDLLIHPEAGVAVLLKEVADLAREEGESDPWVLAARYAAGMLPAIFREGDPELKLRFAPEGRTASRTCSPRSRSRSSPPTTRSAGSTSSGSRRRRRRSTAPATRSAPPSSRR
jgi:hypothetical protein